MLHSKSSFGGLVIYRPTGTFDIFSVVSIWWVCDLPQPRSHRFCSFGDPHQRNWMPQEKICCVATVSHHRTSAFLLSEGRWGSIESAP